MADGLLPPLSRLQPQRTFWWEEALASPEAGRCTLCLWGAGEGGRERIIPTSWLGAGRGRAPHLHTAGRPNSVSSSGAQHTGPSLLSTLGCRLAPIFPPGQGGLLRLHEGPWESAQGTQALRMPRSGPLRPSTDTCLPTSTWPAPTGDLRTSAPAFLPPAPPPPQPFSLCPGC